MTDILLIRHSTTDDVNEKLAGRIDSPLNDLGRQRAQELAVALSHQPIRAVYSSPMQRTMQSAQALADRLHLVVQPQAGLIQVNYGDWESKPFWELEQDPLWRKYVEGPHGQIPGGDHVDEVITRVSTALNTIARSHGGDQMVAVFSHGSIIRFAITHYLEMPVENANRLKIYPASVSVLRLLGEGVGILVSMNRLFLS